MDEAVEYIKMFVTYFNKLLELIKSLLGGLSGDDATTTTTTTKAAE